MQTIEPTAASWTARLRQWLPLAALVGATLFALAMGWHRYLSLEALGRNYDVLRGFISEHYLQALAAYAGLYTAVVALSIPGGLALTIAGGLLFGWVVGSAAAVVSATVGASLLFLVVQTSLRDVLEARAGPFVARLRDGFAENALSYLLFLRLVPLFPFFIINLVPALLGVRLSTFVIGTFFGIIPATVAYSLAGSGLGSVITAQNAAYRSCLDKAGPGTVCTYSLDIGALVTPELVGALGALSVVALIPVALKAWSKRNAGA